MIQAISLDFLGIFLNYIVDLSRYQENTMASFKFDVTNVVVGPLAAYMIPDHALNQFGNLIPVHDWHLDVC